MITHFIEASNDFNYGKFMLARLDAKEAQTTTALQDFEGVSLWNFAGQRKFFPGMTLVVDLQTGEGASFSLDGSAVADLEKHKIWVCPMFEPFLVWLYAQGLKPSLAAAEITKLPRFVQLEAESAFAGYRRKGSDYEDKPLGTTVDQEKIQASARKARRL